MVAEFNSVILSCTTIKEIVISYGMEGGRVWWSPR